jgi:segregation and condensation protein A
MQQPHEKIFEILFEKDEVTWQSILYDLVKTEQMDAWDVDISLLTLKYIETVRKLKEMDLRISGKVLLAAAILLRIKSYKLAGEDLTELDRLLLNKEDEEEADFTEEIGKFESYTPEEKAALIPRVPQPRKRKISIYDLVDALEKALEVKRRRVMHSIPPTHIEIPKRRKEITQVIREVYGRIKTILFQTKGDKLKFSELIPSQEREDKVYTFIPLLHLSHQRKVDLEQEQHFGDIEILVRRQEVQKEIGESA